MFPVQFLIKSGLCAYTFPSNVDYLRVGKNFLVRDRWPDLDWWVKFIEIFGAKTLSIVCSKQILLLVQKIKVRWNVLETEVVSSVLSSTLFGLTVVTFAHWSALNVGERFCCCCYVLFIVFEIGSQKNGASKWKHSKKEMGKASGNQAGSSAVLKISFVMPQISDLSLLHLLV